MFSVLLTYKEKKRFIDKFKKNLDDKIYTTVVPVFKGAPFYIIKDFYKNSVPNWEKIIEISGRTSQRLIVENGVPLPKNNKIGAFCSDLLYGEILKNTFIKILENNYSKNNVFNIMILDKKGDNYIFAEKISKYANTLSIFSEKIENYEKSYNKIIGETGISLFLNKDNNQNVKIDLDKNEMVLKGEWGTYKICNGTDFSVPKIYENIVPQNIDKLIFYSALYELCGVTELRNTYFKNVEIEGEKILTEKVCFT